MHKPIIHFAHWIDANRMHFPFPVEIHNVHIVGPINSNVYNILNLVNEPEPTRMSNEKVFQIAPLFNLILTHNEELLLKCPNAKKMLLGMCWLNKEDLVHTTNKKFKVSTFCTSKNITFNHVMRQRLWHRQKEIINIEIEFWNSSHNPMININNNPFLGPEPYRKIDMFVDTQYHITIENSSNKNYFSEKLIDSLMAKCIPIYVGCNNIGEFFDIDGIITVNNESEIIYICNNILNDKFYESKLKHIENNFQLCQEYSRDFTDRLYEKIMEYISNEQ